MAPALVPLEDYRSRWLHFARAWTDASADERTTLLDDALAHGLPAAPGPAPVVDADALMAVEVAVVRASGVFDAFGYMWHNRDLSWHLCGGPEEVLQFVERGWHELRHPSPGFDLWYY